MTNEQFDKRANAFRKRETARHIGRCPQCGSRLRRMPSTAGDGLFMKFCDDPVCPYEEDVHGKQVSP